MATRKQIRDVIGRYVDRNLPVGRVLTHSARPGFKNGLTDAVMKIVDKPEPKKAKKTKKS